MHSLDRKDLCTLGCIWEHQVCMHQMGPQSSLTADWWGVGQRWSTSYPWTSFSIVLVRDQTSWCMVDEKGSQVIFFSLEEENNFFVLWTMMGFGVVCSQDSLCSLWIQSEILEARKTELLNPSSSITLPNMIRHHLIFKRHRAFSWPVSLFCIFPFREIQLITLSYSTITPCRSL